MKFPNKNQNPAVVPRDSLIDTYGLIGNPVHHSLSQRIHTHFALQTQQALNYQLLLSPVDAFEKTLTDFQDAGGKGVNITAPFKKQAFHLMDEVTQRAQMAGAVNTVTFDDKGRRCGDNTDGIGLIRDFERKNIKLTNKRVLVLGAGGAVAGVLGCLLEKSPALITVVNRTWRQDFFQQYRHFDVPCTFITNSSLLEAAPPFDICINGLAQAILPDITARIFANRTYCYDLSYAHELTIFLKSAIRHGVRRYSDGLGMLIEQAAEAFYIWRGIRPSSHSVLEKYY